LKIVNEWQQRFDQATWDGLPSFFEQLPEPVCLTVWADEAGSASEREAVALGRLLAGQFDQIDFELRPRQPAHSFYPVTGVMGKGETEATDYGVRLIGLPLGYQMTSLVTAIQAVAFRGMTLAARTRIRLHKLTSPVTLELITTAEDEAGAAMAYLLFNMAVTTPRIRSYLIMGDLFPEALRRYSVSIVPHLVINDRSHISGPISEEGVLKQIAATLKRQRAR
jgi:alkyl hydroperoxide reductase subunit AhpF